MPEQTSFGFLDLILAAGPVVQFVMAVLVLASFLCLGIIYAKAKTIKRAMAQNSKFLDAFWHSKSLDEVYGRADTYKNSPVAEVFRSGFKELQKLALTERTKAGSMEVDNINRALSRATNAEIAGIEKHLGWLATTASAAPFIGLFGTVWGIMNSFREIGAAETVNLAIVAPGISEALIATAFGLGAAIPAVIAYNYFVNQIRRLATDIECFSQDFLNIVQRGLMGNSKGGSGGPIA